MNDRLFYLSPASVWHEALPAGNGRVGVMVFGDPVNERIALNEDTVWSGVPSDKNNPDSARWLSAARAALSASDPAGAEEIINRHMLGAMCESYLPFGDLLISNLTASGKEISGYSRSLDMKNGVVSYGYTSAGAEVSASVFVSYPDNLIVYRISSGSLLSLSVTLTSQLRHNIRADGDILVLNGICPESALPTVRGVTPPVVCGGGDSRAVRTAAAMSLLSDGESSLDDGGFKVSARTVEIRLSLSTSFVSYKDTPDADAAGRALSALRKASDKSYDELLRNHISDFSRLFSAFELSLLGSDNEASEKLSAPFEALPTDERLRRLVSGEPDPQFPALLTMYARYLMISSSRPGSHASNLQGVWNESMHPAWCSNYTININTEMNYWHAEATGLGECAEPLFGFIKELSESGKETARVHYGCGGWTAHCNSDIWAYATSCGPVNDRRGCSRYACWPFGSGWLCRHLYEHYLYSGDIGFLRDTALPIMLSAAEFYLDYLTDDGKGRLVTSPSLSPENMYRTPSGETACADIAPTLDIEIVSELFSDCLSAIKLTGTGNELKERLEYSLSRLPSIDERIDGDGVLMEWRREYGETEPEHRHLSPLYALYPASIITKDKPGLYEACRRLLERRGMDSTGWGIIWRACLWARLGEADTAYAVLSNLLRPENDARYAGHGGLYPNLFASCPPFQIDANLGFASAVLEMLCRDDGKTLTPLPACPREWSSGFIRGMRLRGGKTLDMSWENGKLKDFLVKEN